MLMFNQLELLLFISMQHTVVWELLHVDQIPCRNTSLVAVLTPSRGL
jgi:hypothetical protein